LFSLAKGLSILFVLLNKQFFASLMHFVGVLVCFINFCGPPFLPFGGTGGLNLGLHICYAWMLPFEPLPTLFLIGYF
jgi:hypothetical protein